MDISPDDPAATPAETSWHFDKRVPLAMLGALVLQTVSIAWWASGVTFRLEDHERRVTALERTEAIQTQQFTTIAERLARIDERLELMLLDRRPRQPAREQP
jgi:hypothetical protein